jgi:(1->4)-alpha-D-glucan 1-alpha-D-glucosylmutase
VNEFIATYRLQLHAEFGFVAARGVVDYLRDLGVSHLYLSPIWQAREGSMHGYDVTDPTCISSELGGEEEFVKLAGAGLGVILDVVPNHMAADAANRFWSDERLRAQFFDVDQETGFHRRFFDVDDLVGVKVEDPEVFEVTQGKAIELIAAGLADGLRIDHIDGLAEPAEYLARLAERGVAHVWVEKILEYGESLRNWPVEGTTGYEILNQLTALFVEAAAVTTFTELAGEYRSFAEVAHEAKLEVATTTFSPEVGELESLFPAPNITKALASLSVYRTYVDAALGTIEAADQEALALVPEPVRSALALLAEAPVEFITRFQQTTGAVMAKGVEDTALYRYVRLLALNEVGGDPGRFTLSLAEFHAANERRQTKHPRDLLASQTHDTKRSGDVRARLIALTYLADEWEEAVRKWRVGNAELRSLGAPDETEELFIYQTLIGAWPITEERLETYLRKALREAKQQTNWVSPNEAWEEQVFEFCRRIRLNEEFLATFIPLADRIALLGERISLAQLAIRLTAPGVPDFYQGDECWNYSLVDPDNRRPVDWAHGRKLLDGLDAGAAVTRESAKLFVAREILALRRRRAEAFAGAYLAVPSGPTTCAYQRGADVVVAVSLRDQPIDAELPDGEWSNLLADLEPAYGSLPVAVFERRPE